ncbi:MAG: hypothetical protein J5662_08245, partial [Clostridia bacterium]|nr:hypothetical protein [Clostridia bacterium]
GILFENPLSAFAKRYLLNTCITSLPQLALIAGYILVFISSLNNFKRIMLLRVGTILCAVFILFSALYDGLYLFSATNNFYELLFSITFYKGLLETGLISLLYVSIFLLTLGKKDEDIDIAPFIEARKAKKEAKKVRKLQIEAELEAVPEEAPEGYWRCMGCGKLLPDSENKCDCGYKKQD